MSPESSVGYNVPEVPCRASEAQEHSRNAPWTPSDGRTCRISATPSSRRPVASPTLTWRQRRRSPRRWVFPRSVPAPSRWCSRCARRTANASGRPSASRAPCRTVNFATAKSASISRPRISPSRFRFVISNRASRFADPGIRSSRWIGSRGCRSPVSFAKSFSVPRDSCSWDSYGCACRNGWPNLR